jgi:hypothetical protein
MLIKTICACVIQLNLVGGTKTWTIINAQQIVVNLFISFPCKVVPNKHESINILL